VSNREQAKNKTKLAGFDDVSSLPSTRLPVEARKAGPRRLVDVVSLKAYCESLPKKTDHLPIVFDRRAHAVLRPRSQIHH
jgi:hypothetical protein